MGGNYEEINVETQKAIVTFMSTRPNLSVQEKKATPMSAQIEKASPMLEKSAQLEKASSMPKESKECVQIEEASSTLGSPPHSFV